MSQTVGVRELRQHLSRHLDRVKEGATLVVTERGREVARLVPSGASAAGYSELAVRFGASVPTARLEDVHADLLSAGAVGTRYRGRAAGREPRSAARLKQREHGLPRHECARLRTERTEGAHRLLESVALIPLDEATLRRAEQVAPATVASLDAVHLATALALSRSGLALTVMTYDARLAEGARHHGLPVLAPA